MPAKLMTERIPSLIICPKLKRDGYKRYVIVAGPATGTIIEAASNPNALPCFRWGVVSGASVASTNGFTLRGLAIACHEAAGLNDSELSAECIACEMDATKKCPNTRRMCGHHSNTWWFDDGCRWCGKVYQDESSPESPGAQLAAMRRTFGGPPKKLSTCPKCQREVTARELRRKCPIH